jgi:hypothetical protein
LITLLTYLKNETEKAKAKDASGLMKHLKLLKNKYGLSILVPAPPAGLEPCFLNVANFNFSELSMLVELK